MTRLVEQQGQILSLLTTLVQHVNSPAVNPPAVHPVIAPAVQLPEVKSSVAPFVQPSAVHPPIVQPVALPDSPQQVFQQQLPQQPKTLQQIAPPTVAPRPQTPTLLDLLDTTDEELDSFLNSPWLSSEEFTRNPPSTLQPLPPLPNSLEPTSSTCTSEARQLHLPSFQCPSGATYQSSSLQPSVNQPQSDVIQDPKTPSHDHVPPPTFNTPQKLVPVEQVMKECPGTDRAALWKLAGTLARDAIFGKEELRASSLKGGRKTKTKSLDKQKLDNIKTVVRT